MNPLLLYELLEALALLHSGRAKEAMAAVDADLDEARDYAAELRADR